MGTQEEEGRCLNQDVLLFNMAVIEEPGDLTKRRLLCDPPFLSLKTQIMIPIYSCRKHIMKGKLIQYIV